MREGPWTVLVTGAAGFIGSHVVDLLLAQGRRVIAVDVAPETPNLAGHRTRANERLSIVTADLRGDFAGVLAGARPDAVVHLAVAEVALSEGVRCTVAP